MGQEHEEEEAQERERAEVHAPLLALELEAREKVSLEHPQIGGRQLAGKGGETAPGKSEIQLGGAARAGRLGPRHRAVSRSCPEPFRLPSRRAVDRRSADARAIPFRAPRARARGAAHALRRARALEPPLLRALAPSDQRRVPERRARPARAPLIDADRSLYLRLFRI